MRMPGIARLTSLEDNGVIACSGLDDSSTVNRIVHNIDKPTAFTPRSVGNILVPMFDVWYHKTRLAQHLPFVISEPDEVQINVTKPTVIVEFTKEEPDVKSFTTSWMNQIEDGLIEIVTR